MNEQSMPVTIPAITPATPTSRTAPGNAGAATDSAGATHMQPAENTNAGTMDVLAVPPSAGNLSGDSPVPGTPGQPDARTMIQITQLPSNGTLVLADGITPVRVGEILSFGEAVGLYFIRNPDTVSTSVQFGYTAWNPGGPAISRWFVLPLSGSTPNPVSTGTEAPLAATPGSGAAAARDATLLAIALAPSVAAALSTEAGASALMPAPEGPTQTRRNSATVGTGELSALGGISLFQAAGPAGAQNDQQMAAALPPSAAQAPNSPGGFSVLYNQSLGAGASGGGLSTEAVQPTGPVTGSGGAPANGRASVTAGEQLTPAQAAGLRPGLDTPAPTPQGTGTMPAAAALASPSGGLAGQNTLTANIQAPATASPAPAPTIAASPQMVAAPLAAQTLPASQNPIVLENEKPGTPQSVWQVAPGQDSTRIQGFTTSISTALGGTVQFKIDNQTGNGTYSIQIYRLGYYAGDGATLVTTINHSGSPVVQPNPLVDNTTGLVDAGNWSVTDSWAVPSGATSGVYVANVIDGSQIFQIPFVVTNPNSTSDIVFQTSDETWQAYNGWGGDNLYSGAVAVSYNRPIVTRDSIGTYAGPQDSLFGAEYSAIYWLEQNGYDVSYISGIDAATNGQILLNHKVFMDAGHDEYWTDSQFANVEAAKNAGVNLAFFSGNEIFWQTRLAAGISSSADANRTLISYKDTHSNQIVDPTGTATGTFQDPRFGTPPLPSNELTGTLFQVDQNAYPTQITIPYGQTQLRFWRNTSVAQTAPNQSAALEPGLLGYEWDAAPDNGYMPAGLIDLSTTTVQEPTAYNTNWGSTDTSGTATHNLVEYRDPASGALVFGAGTVFWSWGLSTQHDNAPAPFSSSTTDPNVQQATVNMLADMGVQPQTLQASLVLASKSTDTSPPTSSISAVSNATVVEGRSVTVTGTATDTGGGVIGGVQVSTDGGSTWHQATGQVGSASMSWTYTFTAPAPGSYTIESRAVNDSLYIETPGPGVAYTVTPSADLSLFSATAAPPISSDTSAIEVGVQFTAATVGMVTGIRFYKGTGNTGTHIGSLWTSTGVLLASATFTNETASGWQQVNFATPVSITPGTTYVASYHTNTGHYADTPYYFATYQGQTVGSLNAPGDSLNGMSQNSSSSTFPGNPSTASADNFWVDVVFNDSGAMPPVLGNLTAAATYAAGGVAATLSPNVTVSDPQVNTLVSGSVSITGGFIAGDTLAATTAGTGITASYDAANGVLSLTGSDTLAHYQQVLDSVTYASSLQDPTQYGADASRTISWSVNDGTVASATQSTAVNITGGPPTATLFGPGATPATVMANDPQAIDIGVKFQASTDGEIIGVRFYKGAQNLGTHVGDLWTSTGILLASATFTNETASGWQQVNFATPVNITAGTTYIASYEAPLGQYAADANYFTSAVTNGPLTAPSSASGGGNGVYAYGSGNPFPNNSYSASNYWVDVAFLPAAPLAFTAPGAVSGTAQEGAVLTAVSGITNDPGAVISAYQWQSSGDGGLTWSDIAGASAATYTPVEGDETRLLRVVETATDSARGQSATSASAPTAAVADITLAFTGAASITGSPTVGALLQAVNGTLNDADAAVTGYQWQSSADGGTVWSNIGGAAGASYTPATTDMGKLLRVVETATDADGGPGTSAASAATIAVTNATLVFTTPAALTGSAREGSALIVVNGVTSDANAAIAAYQWQGSSDGGATWSDIAGATAARYTPVETDETHLLRVVETAIDTSTWQSGTSVSAATAPVADITLAFTSAAAISGAAVVGSTLRAANGSLNDADAAITRYQWQSSGDGGTTWFEISGATGATYTPVATDEGTLLRVVETATDADGGPGATSTSAATAAISAQPVSLFSPSATPGTITVNDPGAVDLGVKFQVSISGQIIGIRFYKGPQNTGTHVGDLWTATGVLLASATFTNETASGWQQVDFATPVSVTEGTTYIASYEAPVGEYSADSNYFTSAVTNGPLTALSSASGGGNGVYAYGSGNPFPNSSYNASNYWVDVVFATNPPLSFASPAAITGSAQEGSVLTAVNAVPNDPNAVISGYRWQSSSDGGATWSDIAGATAATYTPTETDETHLLRVVETASDSGTQQNGISGSASTAPVADIALAFVAGAAISGAPVVGSVLSALTGTLNEADAAVSGYQWQASSDSGATWSDITGANGMTYVPATTDRGHLLRVVETATDSDGGPQVISASAATNVVTDPGLTFTTPASVTGLAQQGATLTAVNGISSDANAAIAGYQWQSSADGGSTWSNIAGATAATYIPVEADETHLLRVVETAIDTSTWQSGISVSAASAPVTDIPLAFTAAAAISGAAAVGSPLSAANGTLNDADAAVTGYQWQSSSDGGGTWSNLSGATGAVYVPVAGDLGHLLRVVETASDADGGPSVTSTSAAASLVTAQLASLFSPSATPGTITVNDPGAVDLGMKFQVSTSGQIVGIRFYKGPQNTGTHIGDLWTSTGILLASATFTNETASGWQQVDFATPVDVTAGVTYIASYEAPAGEYSADANYFSSTVTNGPLIAPSDASSGGNGVYAYGSGNPFPNNSYGASNYWVDVVFATSPPLAFSTPAAITGTAQEGAVLAATGGSTNDPNAVISGYQWQGSADNGATWSNILDATGATYTPVEADETHLLRLVETASDSSTGQTATSTSVATAPVADIALAFTTAAAIGGTAAVGSPLSAVNGSLNDADAAVTQYQWQSSRDGGATWSDLSGATGATYTPLATDQGNLLRVVETATDADGGPGAISTSAPTTVLSEQTVSLFAPGATPASVTVNDPGPVDLGVKFQATTSGQIVGIRFYKGPQNTGTHIGDLWTSTGTLLASATFTNESASGWQQVEFATPVDITAGTTYIASYEAPVGEYSVDANYFANAVTAGPLTAPSSASSGGNGVYAYGSGNPFPNNSYNASNYWVDVMFAPSLALAFTAPAAITGSAREGAPLTAASGTTNDPNATISGYQWQSSNDAGTTWSDIVGATAASYTPVESDETHLLRVVETASDSQTGQSATSASAATAGVADITLAFTAGAAISGAATVGSTLSAVNGTLNDADAAVTAYQWQSSTDSGTTWSDIGGAGGATYTPVTADTGNLLRVVETATDADGGPGTTSTSSATAPITANAATGFAFSPATASLQALQGGGANLSAATAVGTFTQTGGTAGDSFTYALSGSPGFSLTSPGSGTLSTGAGAVAANTVAALVLQIDDVSTGGVSAPLPFDVVVGSAGADTINLQALGIAASTPALIYGLAGSDALDATGMTGPTWMVGGAGADTMTGGAGTNTYLYAAASDSTPAVMDIITNFNVALDRIDLTGIGTVPLTFQQAQLSTSIAAQSIGWQQSGGNTFVYVNTGAAPSALGSASMAIELNNSVALTGANFLHA